MGLLASGACAEGSQADPDHWGRDDHLSVQRTHGHDPICTDGAGTSVPSSLTPASAPTSSPSPETNVTADERHRRRHHGLDDRPPGVDEGRSGDGEWQTDSIGFAWPGPGDPQILSVADAGDHLVEVTRPGEGPASSNRSTPPTSN